MPPAAKGSALGTRQDLPALDPVFRDAGYGEPQISALYGTGTV